MKMLKKLLAVVLTGAMALTLLTACGSNAVTEKDLADALNDMAKAEAQAKGQDTYITFTPRAKEREMARQLAALLESKTATATVADGENDFVEEANNILGCNKGGENETKRFVWCGAVVADEIGATGQAYHAMNTILNQNAANAVPGKKLADIRHIGTALGTLTIHGKQTTVRFIVVTADVVN